MAQILNHGQSDTWLLRVRRESAQSEWRFWVQNIRTGEQKGFADLGALVDFLNASYGPADPAAPLTGRAGQLRTIGD
jgi:hypothetical protein